VLCFGAFAAAARADDWPQWLGPERDGVWRETGIIDKFPASGSAIRWRTPVGGGYAGPAVAGGRVYVTDRVQAKDAKLPKAMARGNIAGTERVLCLNEADGSVIWKHEYDCPYTISYPSGPRTTPIVRDHRVYTLGAEGNLFCLDADTGKPQWSRELKKDYDVKSPVWGFSASPLLDGQKLICIVGGKGHVVVAFDKDSGKEIWRALSASFPGYCPPMIYEAGGKRQLIIWDGENVSSLDPETGKVYWAQPVPTYYGMSISTPRKAGNFLFLTGSSKVAVVLNLHPDSPAADVAWKAGKDTGIYSVFGTPFIEDGYIYGSHTDGKLACISLDANEKGDLIIARLSPKGYEEISRAHVLAPTTYAFGDRDVVWSAPAFADRCAFMRNDKEIVCVALGRDQGSGSRGQGEAK
jgi:outer membrane protein assembly factor BamB